MPPKPITLRLHWDNIPRSAFVLSAPLQRVPLVASPGSETPRTAKRERDERPDRRESSEDVVAAEQYAREIWAATIVGNTSPLDLPNALVWEHPVIEATAKAEIWVDQAETTPPPWFKAAFDPFAKQLNADVAKLHGAVNRLERFSARSHNWPVASELAVPFKTVPFLDGTDPTGNPHNLPLLANKGVVNRLTNEQSKSYHAGYGPDDHGTQARNSEYRE